LIEDAERFILKEEMNYKFPIIAVSFFSLVFLALFLTPSVSAQAVGCAITKVGNPAGQPPALPPECQSGVFTPPGQIIYPQNMKCVGQYCQLPDPPTGSSKAYVKIRHHSGGPWQDWGSREMIGVIYTVAQNWKFKYPQGYVIVGDIASNYHLTHDNGLAADITATTNLKDCVAQQLKYDNRCAHTSSGPFYQTPPVTYGPYNAPATIELGKLFMDTGKVRQIIYWDKSTNVISELRKYAKNTNIAEKSDHPNHFHIDIRGTNLPNCKVAGAC
jgi:hypothetical protein